MDSARDAADGLTLHGALAAAVSSRPDNVCLVVDSSAITYGDLWVGVGEFVDRLRAAGVGRGSRVGLFFPNSVEAVEALFACSTLGAVAVVINTRFSPPELAHAVTDSHVDTLLVSSMRNDRVDYSTMVTAALPAVSIDRELQEISDQSAPRLRRVMRVEHRDATARGMQSSGSHLDLDRDAAGASATDVALMIYTSGTTSLPKGCQLSHEAIVRGGRSIARDRFELTESDRLWDPLPFFHLSFLLPFLACVDARAAFVTQLYFDASAALTQIREQRVSAAWPAFPAITQALLDHPDYREDVMAQVRVMLNVAPPETLRQMQKRTPNTVQVSAYGCSEGGGVSAVNDMRDSLEDRTQTQGRPFPGVEIAAMDPLTREIAAPGVTGELVIRGWGVFAGYWNDPDRSGEALDSQGWLHTGDLGAVDASGRVSYRGRMKDMIKVGGENVAALEIESVIAAHPDVLMVAVVSVPDDRLIEVPVAVVELRAGAVFDEVQLLEHCRSALARYKIPKRVLARQDWPMSATKIQKHRLRDEVLAELSSAAVG